MCNDHIYIKAWVKSYSSMMFLIDSYEVKQSVLSEHSLLLLCTVLLPTIYCSYLAPFATVFTGQQRKLKGGIMSIPLLEVKKMWRRLARYGWYLFKAWTLGCTLGFVALSTLIRNVAFIMVSLLCLRTGSLHFTINLECLRLLSLLRVLSFK